MSVEGAVEAARIDAALVDTFGTLAKEGAYVPHLDEDRDTWEGYDFRRWFYGFDHVIGVDEALKPPPGEGTASPPQGCGAVCGCDR